MYADHYENLNFNSRDPYGPRWQTERRTQTARTISIHATHTGRDKCRVILEFIFLISIHATHTGRDFHRVLKLLLYIKFQFTRPIRAAMSFVNVCSYVQLDFNSRDPYGPRLNFFLFPSNSPISIHATHTGRDQKRRAPPVRGAHFNSRDPYGPRLLGLEPITKDPDFNSRDPYGPRFHCFPASPGYRKFQFTRPIRAAINVRVVVDVVWDEFQFTRPIRAAMGNGCGFRSTAAISIHATHTGRDHMFHGIWSGKSFQFTRPIRAAIVRQPTSVRGHKNFNSRDPYGPRCEELSFCLLRHFNSRDPYGPRFGLYSLDVR